MLFHNSLIDKSPNEYGLPQAVACAPQNRLQVISVAMSKLVPSGTFTSVPLDLMDISPFYFMQIHQPVLVAAMDTLALVQLGTAFKNPSVVMQAKRSYGRSLRLLMQTVSRLQPEECWDEQIVSAVLITALSGVSRKADHALLRFADKSLVIRCPAYGVKLYHA